MSNTVMGATGTATTGAAESHAVQRRDRPWVGTVLSLLLGPVDLPSVDGVRAALVRVAAENPHARIGWRLDPDALRWTPGEPTDDMVTQGEPWDESTGLGEVVDALVENADPHLPLQFVVFPSHLGMVVWHALGDGRSNGALIEAVAAAANSGRSHTCGRVSMIGFAPR